MTPSLFASALPSSRSVQVGSTATFFATVLNAGDGDATACSIQPQPGVPELFFFQQTDPTNNALLGARNAPVDINAGAAATFLVGFEPDSEFEPTDIELFYDCENANPAPILPGLNTVLLGASSQATADVIALAATPDADGTVTASQTGVFSVASVNVGAGAQLTVTADTGDANLPLDLTLCQTNPADGACTNPVTPSAEPVVASINAGGTPTFGIFLNATADIPFDPANHRINVRFQDGSGRTRGATSVAVRTLEIENPGPDPDPGEGEVIIPPSGNINSPQGGTIGAITAPLSAARFANQFTAPVGRPVAAVGTIAYVRATSTGPNLRTIRGDGSNDRSLADIPDTTAFAGDLNWRPDGTEIAFVSNFELGVWSTDLYAITVDGSNLRRLTSVPRPIAYPNYPQGRAVITLLHPDITGGVSIGYIEGSQQAFGWLGSAVDRRVVDFPVADFGDNLFQESVLRDQGLCYFDLSANVDAVAGTTVTIAQLLPPTSISNDFACPQHLSPQWLSNDEIFYMKRRAADAETVYRLNFALTRGPVDNLDPTTDGETLQLYERDRNVVEGNVDEFLSVRINPVPSTNEFLLLGQAGRLSTSIKDDKLWVGSLAATAPLELSRLPICPDQRGCDLGDAQFIAGQPSVVYSTLVTPLALTTLKSRLRLFTNNDGVATDETLVELDVGNLGRIAVSPDGRRFLVERTGVETNAVTQLWMYDRDTGEFTQFIDNGSSPAWRG